PVSCPVPSVSGFVESQSPVLATIRGNLMLAQSRQAMQADRHRRDHDFSVSD
ncbi:hypothetical protein BGZ49_001704, partial [Haplosporangium sp. Z 27]